MLAKNKPDAKTARWLSLTHPRRGRTREKTPFTRGVNREAMFKKSTAFLYKSKHRSYIAFVLAKLETPVHNQMRT